jgi:hypothetical protein
MSLRALAPLPTRSWPVRLDRVWLASGLLLLLLLVLVPAQGRASLLFVASSLAGVCPICSPRP